MVEFYDYNEAAWGNQLNGPNGKKVDTDFRVDVLANAPRIVYTWKPKIGPLYYATGLITPFVHTRLRGAGFGGSSTRFSDVTLENYLYYANPQKGLFAFFGFETFIPVGSYKGERPVNIGRNHWGFAPNINLTYKPTPRLEISATAVVELSLKNKATDYRSGNIANLDYGISYSPFRKDGRFFLGVNGFFLKQISDDRQNGASVAPDGFRSTEVAVGPQAIYYTEFGGLSVKYQHDVVAKNRPTTNRLWVQFAVPLAGKPRSSTTPVNSH
jgi:hypothetical protein